MNELRKKVVTKVISELDKHIFRVLSKDVVEDDKLQSLTDVRTGYVEELNSIVKSENTSEMFDRK